MTRSSLLLAMPRVLPRLRLRLRRLSQRQPARKRQRRSSILNTRMRTTRSALAGPPPPSPLLPHQPPQCLPHQLSPQPPHASVSILPPLPGACAFAELAVVIMIAAASVQRVFTVQRGRCTCVARVSQTSSGSSSKRTREDNNTSFNFVGGNLDLALWFFFSPLQRTMTTITNMLFIRDYGACLSPSIVF